MRRRLVAVGLVLVMWGAVRSSAARGPSAADRHPAGGGRSFAAQSASAATAQPAGGSPLSRDLLDRYCVGCHNQRSVAEGRPAFDQLNLSDVGSQAAILEKILTRLQRGEMPPDGSRRPERPVIDSFVAALEAALDKESSRQPNAGRVAAHRLNRSEYVNAIEDLLGLTVDGSQLLPSDLAGFGFDNNADVLSVTPASMSRYSTAATKISRAAVGSMSNRPVQQLYTLGSEPQDGRMNEDMPFATRGGIAVRHHFPLDGEYVFSVRLDGSDAGGINGIEDEHQIELRLDHVLAKRFSIGGKFKGPDPGALVPVEEDDVDGQALHDYRMNADKALEIRLPVEAGTRLVAVTFTESVPTPFDGSEYGRPGIDKLIISGPFAGTVPKDSASRRRIFVCYPTSVRGEERCVRRIFGVLVRRAYRRPVTDRDLQPMLASYTLGRQALDFDTGIERGIETLLSMPEFLFHVERQPGTAQPKQPHQLSDLDLASRLSFFLWRSIPDDELLDLAARNRLQNRKVWDQQVRRMLADSRATRFMNDFVGQWLQIRNLFGTTPDAAFAFNDALRKAVVRETELFFENQVREDRPIQELLRANYTYLNEPLARHYGISGIYGSQFRRVALANSQRGGILGNASVLTTTSYADRTSVVLRGKWVLENLLGAPPPPPPPNVPTLPKSNAAKPTSLRERMQQHRTDPVCASCHTKMDPLGFVLENYDAVGRWRQNDGGAMIDPQVLVGGAVVDGPAAFREILARNPQFIRTVTEKLLIFALGRGVDYYDQPAIRQIVRDVEKEGYRWSALVLAVTRSMPFEMRQAEDIAPGNSRKAE